MGMESINTCSHQVHPSFDVPPGGSHYVRHECEAKDKTQACVDGFNIGALIIRIGFRT